MKRIQITVLLISVFTLDILNAYDFRNFTNISWDWIVIFVLTLLFFLILVSLIKDLKNSKKVIKEKIIKEKCDTKSKFRYIYDINKHRIDSTKNLENSIKNETNTFNTKVLKNIQKHYKEIFLSNQEEDIFLKALDNKPIGKVESFLISDMLDELDEYNIVNKSNLKVRNYKIVANKEIIFDIIFLLNKLQVNEHQFKEPSFVIEVDESKNKLFVKIDRDMPITENTHKLFQNNLDPIYIVEDNKYYGVYLYLVKNLADRINSTVKIITDEDRYKIELSIPIDIQYENIEVKEPEKRLRNSKKALIIDDSHSYAIAQYLKSLNFETTVESIKELNHEIPNFMDFDVVFMNSSLFEPILTDYLETIKQYSDFKIVALVNKKNSLYPAKLVDEVVNLNALATSIFDAVSKLYGNEMDYRNSNTIEPQKQKENKPKRGKVLVADDDVTNLHILSYMLRQYNLDVITNTNGEDVLKTLKSESFDLIILDSIMPKLDGYETIKKIRENSKFNATPVVIHSSFSTEQSSVDMIFELGFDAYLPKPFNKNDLESILHQYLPIKLTKKRQILEEKFKKKVSKKDLKEFIAIYSDSDKMLERYIKENRYEQTFSLLKDLKIIAKKIDAKKFIKSIEEIEQKLKEHQDIDSNLIYSLSANLQDLKIDIIKKLSA